jgi:hypothetical protein
MFYAFRIRPLARLFLAAVLVWLALTCVVAAKQVPTSSAILLMLTGGLSFLGALAVGLGLTRWLRAYGRTWIG